ncbi:hypothetical protein KM043_005795 [Ampulex compressa]|nr:hypothetical protein KM043_005795 [Ampulex compressa]
MALITNAVYVLAVFLCFVDGRRQVEELRGPHAGIETDCRGMRMRLNEQMTQVKCTPRPNLVRLQPEPGYIFLPEMVSYNRCEGFCASNLACMPMESKKTSILIQRQHIKSWSRSCFHVHVEEHTKCKCKCSVLEEDCNHKQIYVPDDCACKCMNIEEQLDCSFMKGMVWNSQKCKCVCAKEEEECSTDLEWIPSLCRCAKVIPMN